MNFKNPTYFAARNGYNGFTSYFDKIFSPNNYSKIFILKGGPGTGKSTLMKRIRDAFSDECELESILCSSDPKSLDGVIVKNEGRRIAVLDGTAPHTTDPTLPAAAEEIVDLAKAIQEKIVRAERPRLSSLLEKKRFSYNLAYHFLLVCGEIDRNYRAVSSLEEQADNKSELRYLLDALCFCPQGKEQIRLYDAFGKDGFTHLPYPFDEQAKIIKIKSNPSLMQAFYDFIQRQKKGFIHIPCVLTGKPKCLYLPDASLALVHEDAPALSEDMRMVYDESLLLAQAHFKDAAEHHREMEEIYYEALSFELLDEIADDLIKKIKVLFSIS